MKACRVPVSAWRCGSRLCYKSSTPSHLLYTPRFHCSACRQPTPHNALQAGNSVVISTPCPPSGLSFLWSIGSPCPVSFLSTLAVHTLLFPWYREWYGLNDSGHPFKTMATSSPSLFTRIRQSSHYSLCVYVLDAAFAAQLL